ncbi:hypothetical protein GCM10023219_32130 [Stakelama sediminis]
MIGKLQIIFGIHPVALHLRITSEVFVFFEQLRGITAIPAVDTIGAVWATAALWPLAAAAATAAGLTIVHQGLNVLLSTL